VSEDRTLAAKCCYSHLGGTLGSRLFQRMLELGWFEPQADDPKHYALTRRGVEKFIEFGVDPYDRR
jgi:hypothetical protein